MLESIIKIIKKERKYITILENYHGKAKDSVK